MLWVPLSVLFVRLGRTNIHWAGSAGINHTEGLGQVWMGPDPLYILLLRLLTSVVVMRKRPVPMAKLPLARLVSITIPMGVMKWFPWRTTGGSRPVAWVVLVLGSQSVHGLDGSIAGFWGQARVYGGGSSQPRSIRITTYEYLVYVNP